MRINGGNFSAENILSEINPVIDHTQHNKCSDAYGRYAIQQTADMKHDGQYTMNSYNTLLQY